MAITKVGTYRNPPEDITDYEAIVAHLEAYTRQIGNQGMILTEWTNNTTQPKIAMGSYISHGGVLYVVDTEDYVLPALSSNGTYYLRVATSGDTLAITYTTNIADYSWNAVYGGLYHADESQALPYQVVKNAGAVEKYKMLNPWQVDDFAVVNYLGVYHGRGLSVTGAISGASLNTGQGANELYAMNQNVRTTDATEFLSILSSMLPKLSAQNAFSVAGNSMYTVPRGIYVILSPIAGTKLEYCYNTVWYTSTPSTGMLIISDGTNTRLNNTVSSTGGAYYLKF